MRKRIRLTCGLALALGAIVTVPGSLAAQVRLDPGFGNGGIARTPLPPAFDTETFKEVAAAPDGGVLARAGFFSSGDVNRYGPDGALLGEETRKEAVILQPPEAKAADGGRLAGVGTEAERDGAVSRYGAEGSLDTSFGSGGVSESLPFDVEAVAALPSGKVLAAGAGVYSSGGTKSPPVNQVFVARLGADGKLDSGFGQGGIVKLRSEEEVTDLRAFSVQGRPGEGAEVVVESTVIALDASGKLDPSFGKGGKVATLGQVIGARVTADEALLVAGTRPREPGRKKEAEAPEEFYVARYTAAGKLDPAYAGGSGVAVLAPEGEAQAGSALFESNGSVLIGGLVKPRPAGCPHGYSCHRTPAVVRFTPDGRPDAGFGKGGLVLLPALSVRIGSSSYLYGVDALAARPGGGVFAAGEAERAAFVAAIGGDGSLVGSFGVGGIVTKSSPHTAYAAPIATGVDGAGDVFVVAQTNSGMWLSEGVVVLRYSPNGKLDRAFGEEGEAFVPPGAQGLAVAPNGSTYITSASESTLTKLTPAGALDPSFGTEGSVVFPSPKRYAPWAVVRLANGDLVVAGDLDSKHGSRPAVLRYLPDGKIDRSFGRGGVEVVKLGRGRQWQVETMTVDRKGRILLAGSAPRRHPHGCCTQAGMLIRLAADGRLDRRFGRGGAVLAGGGALTQVHSLALRGNRILAVAAFTKFSQLADVAAGELLFSFRPDGRPDRHFADHGVARVLLSSHRKRYDHEGEETAAVFSTPHRILVVRAGFHGPLLSFSPSGRLERNFLRRIKGLVPRRQTQNVPVSPLATLDGGNLVLAWSAFPVHPSGRGSQAEVNLQRLLLR